MPMPWENPQGGILPWQVGQYFVQADGSTVQVYPDRSGVGAQTGFVAKITRPDGTVTYQAAPAPINPTAAYDYLQGTPYGQSLQAAERAAADQNTFNRGIAQGGLDVQRQNADTTYYSAQTARMTAEAQREATRAQVEQAKKDLQFRYYQQDQNNRVAQGQLYNSTLQIGAGLRGPYDWDAYLETRARAGQNPLLQQAGQTWSSLTNIRPNTGAVQGPQPQRFDINALAGDFMGAGGGNGGGSFELPRDANLDAVAMNPGAAAPGWWQGMNEDERQRAKGYWDRRGHSSSSILNSLAWTQPTQGLGYGGA